MIAALGTLAAGVIACAAGLWPIAVVLFFGAFTTSLFWAVPYAVYLARVPAAEPPIAYRLTCPIAYGVWQGVPTLWIPGRDPMFDNWIHRRGIGFDLRAGRLLPR